MRVKNNVQYHHILKISIFNCNNWINFWSYKNWSENKRL